MDAACKKYVGKQPRWGTRKEFPKEIRRRARMRGYSVNSNNNISTSTSTSTRKNRPILRTDNENLIRVQRPYRIPYGFERRLPRSGSFFRANRPAVWNLPPLPPSPENEDPRILFSPRPARRNNRTQKNPYLSLRKLRENINTHHLYPNY